METEECWGGSQWYNWLEMGLLGLLSCPLHHHHHPTPPSLSPPRSHSLSISYLSDLHQSSATVSLGEGRGRNAAEPLILRAVFACLTVRLDSSHTPVVCRALRRLSCSCTEHRRAEDLAGLLPDLSACMWDAQRLIPSFLINGIPITLQSH